MSLQKELKISTQEELLAALTEAVGDRFTIRPSAHPYRDDVELVQLDHKGNEEVVGRVEPDYDSIGFGSQRKRRHKGFVVRSFRIPSRASWKTEGIRRVKYFSRVLDLIDEFFAPTTEIEALEADWSQIRAGYSKALDERRRAISRHGREAWEALQAWKAERTSQPFSGTPGDVALLEFIEAVERDIGPEPPEPVMPKALRDHYDRAEKADPSAQ